MRRFNVGSTMIWLAVVLAIAAGAFFSWHARGVYIALHQVRPADVDTDVERTTLEIGKARSGAPIGTSEKAGLFYSPSRVAAAGMNRLPLILYMPGWGGRATDSDVLLRTLAAAGYVIVAIDDVAFDEPAPGESASDTEARTAQFDLSSPTGISAFVAIADRKADLAVAKVARTLDSILEGNFVDPSQAMRAVDPARVAAVGFSFGGSVAASALVRDPRLRAAINLDGWIYGAAAFAKVDRPYLLFSSTNSITVFRFGVGRRNAHAMDELSWARQQPILNSPGASMTVIPGTLHGDYSDGVHGADRWTQWRPWHLPLADPALVRRTVDTQVLEFLARNLRSAEVPTRSAIPKI